MKVLFPFCPKILNFAEGQGDHYVCLNRIEFLEEESIAEESLAQEPLNNNEMAKFENLSLEILEKVFFICLTYTNSIQAFPFFKPFEQSGLAHLPRINISANDLLPKPRTNGEIYINVQQLIRNYGSASGVILELKRIIQCSM